MSDTTFAVNDRVMWSTGRGCPGTVEPRDGWRYPEDLERFPNDVVVKWDDGMHSLVSPGALMAAPTDAPTPAQDHGPLAAHLSDRTLAKVLSRPAHVPSIVLLDAAENLADVATNALQCLQQAGPWTAAGGGPSVVERLEKALSAYREVTS